VWDVTTPQGKQLAALDGLSTASKDVSAVKFAPRGDLLAARDGEGNLVCWKAPKFERVGAWRIPSPMPALAFAPDGRHVAITTDSGSVLIVRLAAD
jgi:WD40 repeat protein